MRSERRDRSDAGAVERVERLELGRTLVDRSDCRFHGAGLCPTARLGGLVAAHALRMRRSRSRNSASSPCSESSSLIANRLVGHQLLDPPPPRGARAGSRSRRRGPASSRPRRRRSGLERRDRRAVLAHPLANAADRLVGGIRLRRERQVDGRLGQVERRLGQPARRARRRGRPPPPPGKRRGSALPMSSLARMTMRRAMKRGSSPPSSIPAG